MIIRLFAACAAMIAASAILSTQALATKILHVETSGNQSTNTSNWTPIQNLEFELPAASSCDAPQYALVIVSLPNPYATGPDYPGGQIAVSVEGAVLTPIAVFTTNVAKPNPPNAGRTPTQLVVRVKLRCRSTQTVKAVWTNVRLSTVIIDTPSSMSAIIE